MNNIISLYSFEKKILTYFSLQIVLMFTVSSFLKTFIEALEYNFTEMQKSPLENASLNQKQQTLGSNNLAIVKVKENDMKKQRQEKIKNEVYKMVVTFVAVEVSVIYMGAGASCTAAIAASFAGTPVATITSVAVCAFFALFAAYTLYQVFDSRPVYREINKLEIQNILNELKTLFCDEKKKGKTNPSDKEIQTTILDDFYEVNNLKNNTFSIDKYLIFLYFLKFYNKKFEFRDDNIYFTDNKNNKQSIFIQPTIKTGEIYPLTDMIYFYIFAYEHEELRETINEILKETIYTDDINTIIKEIRKNKKQTNVCEEDTYTTNFEDQVDVYIFHQLTDIPDKFAIEDYIKKTKDTDSENTKISLKEYKQKLVEEQENLPAPEHRP